MTHDVSPLAHLADEAWQQLGPGIDLFNLTLLADVLARSTGRAEALAALRGITVLGHPQHLEGAVADVDRLATSLESLLAEAEVSTRPTGFAPPDEHAWATGDAGSLMLWLEGLTEISQALRDGDVRADSRDGLARCWRRATAARERLGEPERRRAALEALDAQIAALPCA
ncbi:MAG: hypothetical protein EB084_10225 [Proteobacteria bacterium]|nr:hypothetical protein [Pseudomonadota bacterium]